MKSLSDFFILDKRFSWLWLIVRLYLGWEWISAGYEKIVNPVWVGDGAGGALTGFIKGALGKTAGAHPDVSIWYASFLQYAVLPHTLVWSHFVAYGEFAVGLGLILGVLTFWSAFFGFFMNINYLLAGTVSTNPILLILSLLIMLAHRSAGYIGLDRFIFRKNKL